MEDQDIDSGTYTWAKVRVIKRRSEERGLKDGPIKDGLRQQILELEEGIATGNLDVLWQLRTKEEVEWLLSHENSDEAEQIKDGFRRKRLELEEAIATGTVDAYWQRKDKERKEDRARHEAETLRQNRAQAVRKAYEWLGPQWREPKLEEWTFENFTRALQPKAYDASREFAANPQGNLILCGPPGRGKTHLLAAICNDFNNRIGYSIGAALYVKLRRLLGAVQELMLNNEFTQGLINQAIYAPLLAIDELDKAKAGDFTQRIAFDVIDGRWQAGMPMVIATNDSDYLEELLGEPIVSRLSDNGRVVTLLGNDNRLERRYVHSPINERSV